LVAIVASLAVVTVATPARVASAGAAAAAAAPAGGAPVVAHRALVRLEPGRHAIEVVDTLSVTGAPLDSARLRDGLAVAETARLAPEAAIFRFAGTLHESTEGVVFSRENVGREIEATVGEEGVYLSSGARWLPTVAGALVTTRLTIDTPLGWEPVTNGVCRAREERDGRLITVWEEANPVDGVALVAGRYTVRREAVAGASGPVEISVWLLRDDPKLAATYLERTRAYLAMYEEMIGPYPFGKFATVENWFPTGYGFPSWTLLGGAVMRLPFIPTTSFGHEVCHNWWGNSVYVAEAGGNWCEGLTTYCADYHYKELESPASAREYRRNLLKDYAAYVRDPGKDAPLAQFRARHSGATRAVGYGKAMMVFHQAPRSSR
jgi:hypothetical protein